MQEFSAQFFLLPVSGLRGTGDVPETSFAQTCVLTLHLQSRVADNNLKLLALKDQSPTRVAVELQ